MAGLWCSPGCQLRHESPPRRETTHQRSQHRLHTAREGKREGEHAVRDGKRKGDVRTAADLGNLDGGHFSRLGGGGENKGDDGGWEERGI